MTRLTLCWRRPTARIKALPLSIWYNLSDAKLEDALADRLAFRKFCGFPLDAQGVFGWTLRYWTKPRLPKDWENLADTLHTFVTIASIQLALRRPARK